MRSTTLLSSSVAGFFLLNLCSMARAEPIPPAIQASYTKMMNAFNSCDFKTYATFFAPGYVQASPKGKPVSRAKYLDEIGAQLKVAKSASLRIKTKNAKVHDGIVDIEFEAVRVVVTHKMQADIDAAPEGKPIVANIPVFQETGVDSWKKVGKNWVKIKTLIKAMGVVM